MVLVKRVAPLEWRRRRYFPHQKSPILRHSLQSGVVSILSSRGSDPLKYWSITPGIGTVQRIRTSDVDGFAIDLSSPSFCTTFISAPSDSRMHMACTMPLLTLIIEYLNQPFCFELQLRDSKNMKRRYRCSSCQVTSRTTPLISHLPIHLVAGWNKVEVSLGTLTRLTYNTDYCELLGIDIYANCRIKNVFFSDKKYDEMELPEEYRLKEPLAFYKTELSSYINPMPHLSFPSQLYS